MKPKKNTVLIVVSLLAYWIGLCNASAFYDPGAQRWLNRDPLGDVGQERIILSGFARLASNMHHSVPPFEITEGANLYEFVRNNPVHFFDYSGLHWSFACAQIEKQLQDALQQAMYDESFGNYLGAAVEWRKVAIFATAYTDNGCDDPPPPPPMQSCPVTPPRWIPPTSGPTQKCAWTLVGVGLGGVLEYGWVCIFAL